MNKTELIESIAKSADISKAAAQRAWTACFPHSRFAETWANGDAGWIRHVLRGPPQGASGQKSPNRRIDQDRCCKVPKFRAGKALKDALN